ncbi:MarR family winged helix-turn-helix transcriptional regulator [Furfurilactobacillus siliginis]|uniref:Transcriptional regulator n=1 Tax=Furfurilactobacillus siliginis TaxID=348151 RepID=A0A0R2LBE4_9LACO|nr:MarR family transcriptional regulator [Furfurilactobacillus siliginis]KRN96982.1 transcriptional regulator [Furfurilactobacillus siliginis]GEK27741.1 hypothetical protein LSI01_00520 [Furfurilactobacillus siliginis]
MTKQFTNHELTEKFYALQLLFELEARRQVDSPLVYQQGQGNILLALGQTDGQSQRALSQALNISAPSITEFVTKLVLKGYVRREKSPADKRVSLVFLTSAGRESLRAMQQTELGGWDYLKADQQTQFGELMDQLIHGLGQKYQAKTDADLLSTLQSKVVDDAK